jgi:hypothetical protein
MNNYVEPNWEQMARMALGLSLSGHLDNARDRFLAQRLEHVAKALKLASDMGRDNFKRRLHLILEVPGIDDPTTTVGILPSAK